jgi:hypothetical protein
VDGENWTEIDRRTDNGDFKGVRVATASFAASTVSDARFIRLTQTDKGHDGQDCLGLEAVEFFGTLSE